MNLNSYFDRIFIINMKRRYDRWLEAVGEYTREIANPPSFTSSKLERFDAYEHPTSGQEGCARSHRMLLRKIADGPWTKVLVLEDDFAAITRDRLKEHGFSPESQVWKTHCSVLDGKRNLSHRFDYLSEFLPAKWDMLYLGAGYGEAPISRLNQHVIRCGSMKTTSSYGVTREFAKTMCDKIGPDLDAYPGCIDDVFGSMAHDHLFYVLQPRLMFQRESFSDITGEKHSYMFSMTDPAHESLV